MSKKQSRSLLVWTSSFMWLGCLFDPGDAKGLPCRNDADCGPKLACIGDICGGDDDDDDDDDQNPSAGSADTMTQGGTTGTTPPECAMVGESCEGTPCCADSACVDFGTSTSPQILCAALCNAGSNCLSCCCQPPPGGQSVCVFQDFCDGDISSCNAGSCSLGGSLCSSSTDCCNGLCNYSAAGVDVCFTACGNHSECGSGCCSAANSPTGQSFCQSAFVCEYEYDYGYDERAPGALESDPWLMMARP